MYIEDDGSGVEVAFGRCGQELLQLTREEADAAYGRMFAEIYLGRTTWSQAAKTVADTQRFHYTRNSWNCQDHAQEVAGRLGVPIEPLNLLRSMAMLLLLLLLLLLLSMVACVVGACDREAAAVSEAFGTVCNVASEVYGENYILMAPSPASKGPICKRGHWKA